MIFFVGFKMYKGGNSINEPVRGVTIDSLRAGLKNMSHSPEAIVQIPGN
jgi:hypothetical protein